MDGPGYTIESQVLVEQPTAVTRERLQVPGIPGWIGPAFARVMAAVGAGGRHPVGPPFARYARVPGEDATFDVEAGFPVDGPPSAGTAAVDPAVEAAVLPGGPAAVTVHVGPYEAMTAAYAALERWLEEHAAVAAGPPWEQYLSEPTGDPTTWRTRVVQPYRAA